MYAGKLGHARHAGQARFARLAGVAKHVGPAG